MATCTRCGKDVSLFERDLVERRLDRLARSVDSLKAMIGTQTAEIHQLRQAVEGSPAPAAARSR